MCLPGLPDAVANRLRIIFWPKIKLPAQLIGKTCSGDDHFLTGNPDRCHIKIAPRFQEITIDAVSQYIH